jgi:hypothetical protein
MIYARTGEMSIRFWLLGPDGFGLGPTSSQLCGIDVHPNLWHMKAGPSATNASDPTGGNGHVHSATHDCGRGWTRDRYAAHFRGAG